MPNSSKTTPLTAGVVGDVYQGIFWFATVIPTSCFKWKCRDKAAVFVAYFSLTLRQPEHHHSFYSFDGSL